MNDLLQFYANNAVEDISISAIIITITRTAASILFINLNLSAC
jgi:hypothetical protein